MASRQTSGEHTMLGDNEPTKASSVDHDGREKSSTPGTMNNPDSYPQLDYDNHEPHADKNEIPWVYRIAAFAMIVLFAFGSSFSESTFGPLKSTLRKELGITNAQYGAIASASSLVNTVLPIIGGIYMDHWGATYAAIISSAFILIGAIIASSGANTGQVGLLIGGRVLLGFGSTVIESTQSKLYAHWFAGSNLAFVYGLDIAWSRITTIISRSSAVPMSEVRGWWGWALWIPTIVCGFNLGLCVAYWAFERSLPRKYQPPLGKNARIQEGWAKRYFGLKSLYQLPLLFWILCGTRALLVYVFGSLEPGADLVEVPQNAAVSVYSSNLADIQTETRGTSKLAAGYNSSLQGVIPIILTPAVGVFFDKVGWRMPFVSLTGALYVIVFSLIGLTTVHPLAPILLSSFALSTNAITFIASIPVLVGNDALLGTAFGVWKAFANCNSIILEVAAGAIQDLQGNSYTSVIYLLIAIKSWQVCLGPIYDYLDGKWLNHALRRPEAERLRMRKADLATEEMPKQGHMDEEGASASTGELRLKGWQPSKVACFTVGSQLCCMIVIGWTLYIVYSIGT